VNELASYTERLKEGAMDWKLTDGEIKSEVVALADYPNEQELEAYHRVARAAARKVVEWLDENTLVFECTCARCGEIVSDDSVVCLGATEVLALKQEVGL